MQTTKRIRIIMALCAAAFAFASSAAAELPEIKITNAQMVQMPHFRFILPNSAIEFSVHQQISSATFNIDSKYDILDSFFHIGFDIRNNFAPYFAGVGVSDTIYFEQHYGPKTYFQRTHNVTPYFGYDLGRFTQVKTGISFANTLTASVDKDVEIDKGNLIIESAGIKYNTNDPLNHVPNGTMLSLMLYSSLHNLASDYDYTKGEVDIKSTYMPWEKDYLESNFKFYFPMTSDLRPISEVYFAGGYDLLRGYGYNEFFGDTLMYGKLNYHIPVARNVKKHALRAALQILTIDITVETAQIGNVIDFGSMYSMKTSMSAGLGCDVVMFEHINLKFDTFVGKAMEFRPPVFYFILTAYTYFSI